MLFVRFFHNSLVCCFYYYQNEPVTCIWVPCEIYFPNSQNHYSTFIIVPWLFNFFLFFILGWSSSLLSSRNAAFLLQFFLLGLKTSSNGADEDVSYMEYHLARFFIVFADHSRIIIRFQSYKRIKMVSQCAKNAETVSKQRRKNQKQTKKDQKQNKKKYQADTYTKY